MSIDIHILKNGQAEKLLYSINESSYSILEPIFEKYKNKTGLYIDPYGTLKLSSGLEILISLISEKAEKNQTELPEYKKILSILNEAQSNNYGIIFVGE